MGNGQSKRAVGMVGSADRGLKLTCTLDNTMMKSLIVPDDIAEKYYLNTERYILLAEPDTGTYCCEVSHIDGKTHLTNGWDELIVATGAAVGDTILFEIMGTDDTVVRLFRGLGEQFEQGFSECAVGGDKLGDEARAAIDAGVHTETTGAFVVGDNQAKDLNGPEGHRTDASSVLDAWRARFVIGPNVELEDWMVEYVAEGLGWEFPEYGIYVGRVDRTSVAHNRMRLPRMFTAEHVLPFFGGNAKRVFYMECEREGESILKLSIGKDGRAVFSEGWKDFANMNGITAGSILAFTFTMRQTELDMEIDLLQP